MIGLTQDEYQAILRTDFMSFVERSFYELNPEATFCPSPFIELIAAKLEACRRGEIKRLIINVPPRSLKSHCASIAFPAWYLGHNPAGRIICVSYGKDLADKFARDCRTLMNSHSYRGLFRTRLVGGQAVDDFRTAEHGNRMATSIGGVLTGRGADMVIIDDPLKPEDALSETARNAANEWIGNTLVSRLNDKAVGCIIIIMQRLHQDDLVGHVLGQGNWHVLSLPAIAEMDESFIIDSPLGRRLFTRRIGEALHPQRESLEILAQMRADMGDYNFQSQYQQNPAPAGGAMIKTAWLKYYEPHELPESFSRIVQSWDTANKPGELNDYSVCTTLGVNYRRYYLLDVYRRRLNYPDLRRAVIAQAERFGAGTVLIEDKASGTQLIQDLGADGLFGVQAYTPPPRSDKVMRLHEQSIAFENGSVLLPRTAPWLADYIHELTGFPGTKHDDQVDSTTQALAYLRAMYCGLEVWAKLGESLPRRTMMR